MELEGPDFLISTQTGKQTGAEQTTMSTPEAAAAAVKCAPSKNLNVGFPHFANAKDVYAHL